MERGERRKKRGDIETERLFAWERVRVTLPFRVTPGVCERIYEWLCVSAHTYSTWRKKKKVCFVFMRVRSPHDPRLRQLDME